MVVTQRPVMRASCDSRQWGEPRAQKSQQGLQQRNDKMASTLERVFLATAGEGWNCGREWWGQRQGKKVEAGVGAAPR